MTIKSNAIIWSENVGVSKINFQTGKYNWIVLQHQLGIVLLVLWRHHTAQYPKAEFSIIIRSTGSSHFHWPSSFQRRWRSNLNRSCSESDHIWKTVNFRPVYFFYFRIGYFGIPSTFNLLNRPLWNMTAQFDIWSPPFVVLIKNFSAKKHKFLRIFALALFIVQSIIDICYKGQLRSYKMTHYIGEESSSLARGFSPLVSIFVIP